jgi:hypothetical protein
MPPPKLFVTIRLTFKFGFGGLVDGKGMAIFSFALSPASRELPQRGSLGKRLSGKGFS